MAESGSILSSHQEIAGYRVERELSAGRTYLAAMPGGRRVVLKAIDQDCLLGGQLHPMIKDRLGRVREVAHLGVANLLGAERDGELALLVWEYIEGQSLEAYLASVPRPPRGLARRLALSIEALHALGIVHGALHARNIFITPLGAVRLTHISPLLYTEPDVDVQGLLEILAMMGCGLAFPEDRAGSMREIVNALNEPAEGAGDDKRANGLGGRCVLPEANASAHDQVRWRWAALIGAAAVALIGATLAWGLWRYAGRGAFEPPPASDLRSAAPLRPGHESGVA